MSDSPPRAPRSITTRKGDDGTTSLLYGQRVSKNHPQIEAIGALDELNAALGFAKATLPASPAAAEKKAIFERVQQELISLMGEIACSEADLARYAESKFAKLEEAALARLDVAASQIETLQPKSDGWATPGANLHAAALELARTAARRAERRLVGLPAHGKSVRPLLVSYLNRLSDLLWLLAREAESQT